MIKILIKKYINILFYVITTGLSYYLKLFYSTAVFKQVKWILFPISKIVSYSVNLNFIEKSYGFENHDTGIIINESCAGINFLIIIFASSIFLFINKIEKIKNKILVFNLLIFSAYFLTIAVNSFRIIISIKLINQHQLFHTGSEKFHLITGIVVFLTFLVLYHITLNKIIIKGELK